MKTYSNQPRKPMMYGGVAPKPKMMHGGVAPKPKKKAESGGRVSDKDVSPGQVAKEVLASRGSRVSDKDVSVAKEALASQSMSQLKQMYEQGKDNPKAVTRMKAMAAKSTKEGMMMRSILQRAGVVEYSMGDKEE